MTPPETRKRGLGRGLSALMGEAGLEAEASERNEGARTVPIESLQPGRFQPRRMMAEGDLDDLARSISEKGVLQPILVRRHPEAAGTYEIIAGERRWRAAQRAQLHEVPVVVRDFADGEALEVALVENLQRQDLSALEEAEGYRRLIDDYGHTQEEVAKGIGKSRSHVANSLRLLGLPPAVKALLDEGRLTAGHARALLTADEPEKLARAVVGGGLNVRQTEKLATAARGDAGSRTAHPVTAKDADTAALERDLSTLLGVAVEVRFGRGGGELLLRYTSLDQLDDILYRLSRGTHGRRVVATDAGQAADS